MNVTSDQFSSSIGLILQSANVETLVISDTRVIPSVNVQQSSKNVQYVLSMLWFGPLLVQTLCPHCPKLPVFSSFNLKLSCISGINHLSQGGRSLFRYFKTIFRNMYLAQFCACLNVWERECSMDQRGLFGNIFLLTLCSEQTQI